MIQISIEIPDEALTALRLSPQDFAQELRLTAAVKWYELRRISQGQAAKIAGLSRAEFITRLEQFRVSPFQYDDDNLT